MLRRSNLTMVITIVLFIAVEIISSQYQPWVNVSSVDFGEKILMYGFDDIWQFKLCVEKLGYTHKFHMDIMNIVYALFFYAQLIIEIIFLFLQGESFFDELEGFDISETFSDFSIVDFIKSLFAGFLQNTILSYITCVVMYKSVIENAVDFDNFVTRFGFGKRFLIMLIISAVIILPAFINKIYIGIYIGLGGFIYNLCCAIATNIIGKIIALLVALVLATILDTIMNYVYKFIKIVIPMLVLKWKPALGLAIVAIVISALISSF